MLNDYYTPMVDTAVAGCASATPPPAEAPPGGEAPPPTETPAPAPTPTP